MHTTQIDDDYIVHHNGDFSGDVIIFDKVHEEEIVVPFYVLESIVVKAVRDSRIESLEQASVQAILYGKEV